MSLNGLDDDTVKEAYDAAVAEPGGWYACTQHLLVFLFGFLLKYASRDEIELMGRGNGGIVEMRNKIGQYEEPSPLFGFLRYRRRNVIIKYVPDGCSRLVQARVTVHFNAVTEKFAPHDTIFEITTAKELRDSTLSAACSLHTASGSVSSSTSSLRRRRLMEIAEDEEEDIRIKRQSTVQEEHPPTAQTITSTAGNQPAVGPTTLPPDLQNSFTFSSMVAESNSSLETSPPPPPRSKVPLTFDLDTSPPPPREPREAEFRSSSPIPPTDEVPRKSSQSARPDLYSLASHEFISKPKVRLGPRPSLDVGKIATSGGTAAYRPVSTLPQGLKISTKGVAKKGRTNPRLHLILALRQKWTIPDATRTDSYPVSPVGPSEKAESTRASSISESTDETVQEALSTKAVSGDGMAEESPAHSSENTESEPIAITSSQNSELDGESIEPKNLDDAEQVAGVGHSASQDTITDNTTVSHEEERQSAESQASHEVKPKSPELSITMSSAQDVRAPADPTSGATEALQTSASEPILQTSEGMMGSPFDPGYQLTPKKKFHTIEPIRTSFEKSGPNSEDNISLDDELMDELQSAVIQDAKPMSVAKSPISPQFPQPTQNEIKISRTVSSPLQSANSNPPPLTARPGGDRPVSRPVSASANFLNRINMQPAAAPVVPKKISVGSGVANRIKAFEKFQNLAPDSSAPSTLGPSPTASPAFFSNTPAPNIPREGSPEVSKGRDRSGSIQKRVALLKPTPASEPKTTLSRPESVQVTARIIRDPDQPFPQKPEVGKDPSDYKPLALKESPLIIDHQKAVSSPPKETLPERGVYQRHLKLP
ncbi:hypothetical protein EYC84_003381 [Monilinia fructicola]|uniref:ADF-H domain-containing protein n=1 Tax=Monilinia fructicola TaxID=38448 RepID=A0A5M9JWG3_MONFR|nr:hypothetical protein EYC84_003381 [Monilinia fructicola]